MEQFAPFLAEQGLAGVVIAGLAWWGWTRSKKVDELQSQRVDDMKTTMELLGQTRATNEKLVNAVTALTEEIRRNGG